MNECTSRNCSAWESILYVEDQRTFISRRRVNIDALPAWVWRFLSCSFRFADERAYTNLRIGVDDIVDWINTLTVIAGTRPMTSCINPSTSGSCSVGCTRSKCFILLYVAINAWAMRLITWARHLEWTDYQCEFHNIKYQSPYIRRDMVPLFAVLS